jgi:hypothetical protein
VRRTGRSGNWPAGQVGISPSSVLRIWRAFGLQPWRTETFKVSPDPLLTGKIRDVAGLYLAPPANAVVFSVDEKPQIQAYPGDDPGVCYGGQEPDMTDSRSLTDGISGVSPEQSQRPRTVARRRSVHPDPAAPPVAEPGRHPSLVVAASLTDAPATVLTAETCPSSHRTPDNQALQRTAPVLPMIPGVPERRSSGYVRHGTVDLFAALNIVTGKVIGKLSAQHRAVDFRDFLDQIDRQAGPGLAVHVIATTSPRIRPRRCAAGCWPARASSCTSPGVLTTALEDWIKVWNENARPFRWTKTADQIIDRICRYCSRITEPAH